MSKKIQEARKHFTDAFCALGMVATYLFGCIACPQELQRTMDAREER